MLYEVITPEITNKSTAKIFVNPFFEILSVILIPSIPPTLPPITKSVAICISTFSEIRITSYNVCYTKLLR